MKLFKANLIFILLFVCGGAATAQRVGSRSDCFIDVFDRIYEYELYADPEMETGYNCNGTFKFNFYINDVTFLTIYRSKPYITDVNKLKWDTRTFMYFDREPEDVYNEFDDVKWGTWFKVEYHDNRNVYEEGPFCIDEFISDEDKGLLFGTSRLETNTEPDEPTIEQTNGGIELKVNGLKSVSVTDLFGRCVFNSSCDCDRISISQDKLPQGIMVVTIITKENRRFVRKLAVN